MRYLNLKTSLFVLASTGFLGCATTEESRDIVPTETSNIGMKEVHNGYVYLEGDIILGPADSSANAGPAKGVQSAGVFDRSRGFKGTGTPWPDETVYWRFDASVSAAKQADLRAAANHYHQRTSIRWVEVASSYNGNYVLVTGNDTSDHGCASELGYRATKGQILRVGRSDCNYGRMIHEMGHTLGLIHEHQRPDRDTYVIVNDSETDPTNWGKKSSSDVSMFGDYELSSIMHYCTAQGENITTVSGQSILCQRTTLTERDVLGIQVMYGSEFEPTVVADSWGANRLDAFVRDTSGGVLQKTWDGSQWSQTPLGGYTIGSPEAVSWGSNRLDVFARGGSDLAMWHKAWNGSAWGDWESLGGSFASHLSAVSWGPNRLDVFGKSSATGEVLHKAWDGSSWQPPGVGTFENLGGYALGPIQAVSWGENRVDIFAVGVDLALWHKAWTGSGWLPSGSTWESLGGTVHGRPSIASWGPNRLDIVVKGPNGVPYHKAWNGAQWLPSMTGWESMGGVMVGNPSAVSWGPNRLDVFVHGTNENLYHMAWDGGQWIGWTNLGGTLTGSPSVASWGSSRLDVFVRGPSDALYHKVWSPSTNWWPATLGYEDHPGTIMSW